MSLVSPNDGYHNIFGAPKPAPFGAVGAALDKVVSSPVFPILAGGIVTAGLGAYMSGTVLGSTSAGPLGAGSTTAKAGLTALKGGSALESTVGGVVGLGTALSGTQAKPTTPNIGIIKMADPTTQVTNSDSTQLPGLAPQVGTAQIPAQPIVIQTAPSASTNSAILIGGCALIVYLLMKGKR